MRHLAVGLGVLTMTFASLRPVRAAEHFGVQIYGSARLDSGETAFLRDAAGVDGYFYRTSDSVEKVLAFYRKHAGLTALGSDASGGKFTKEADGRTVYVNIDSPWQPSKGGELSRDTRIVVLRE